MDLGLRLKQARQEAGLSQRQLCGDVITRNMLSQIENGSARPSMDTLRYLAQKLGKPVSFFLEENAVLSPNHAIMEQARQAYIVKDYAKALELLEAYQPPDAAFDAEFGLLKVLCLLCHAEAVLSQGKGPYAAALLEQAARETSPYLTHELQRRRLLLLAQAQPEQRDAILAQLPPDDRALLLQAEAAVMQKDYLRAQRLLEAAQNQTASRWSLLRGQVAFAQKDYPEATRLLLLAQQDYPRQTYAALEQCYLHAGDYKMAYLYACKQREQK